MKIMVNPAQKMMKIIHGQNSFSKDESSPFTFLEL
jgi:hypothetical protein